MCVVRRHVHTPLALPSLVYVGSHADHHRRATFGTAGDPEYAPLALQGRLRLAAFVLQVLAAPPMLLLRWAVLAPLSYLIPPLRRPVVGYLSTLVINPGYRRPLPVGRQARRWLVQELAACATVWAAVAAYAAGLLPGSWIGQWFAVTTAIVVMNQLRTLTAHGYAGTGEPVDLAGQIADSSNTPGAPVLTALVAPVGLRFHALHHYLPSLPYHNLGAVHRFLTAELPPDGVYRRAERPGILSSLARLWRRAGR